MRNLKIEDYKFEASKSSGKVSAILVRPEKPKCLLVLGHGAGAGIRHVFMESLASELANNEIASFRYHFPYMEQGKKAPDPQPILLKTVKSACDKARELAGALPIFTGGKSLGGRMTSTLLSKEAQQSVRGIIFFGFPLHAPGKPGNERAEHLFEIRIPMLFMQGTRDKLAEIPLIGPVCQKLGGLATLKIIEDADHSFHVPKRSGKTDEEIMSGLAKTTSDWIDSLLQ